MKVILFAAALTLGTAAIAQSGNTVSDPSQSTGPRGITQQGTNPEGQPCTPAGFNQGMSVYPTCPVGAATAQSATNPPPCSRTVTDHCIQTYERGVRRR
ncbi:MAG TPA: hypothetical protein VNT77_09425 [Allosphingosinicella sp.]|nr:hypothetical protein [Allosphingosinicella sp.]